MAYKETRPIFITGGTGFIGSYLAMRLLKKEGNENEQVFLFYCNPDLRRLTGFNERYEKVKKRITSLQGDPSSLELAASRRLVHLHAFKWQHKKQNKPTKS